MQIPRPTGNKEYDLVSLAQMIKGLEEAVDSKRDTESLRSAYQSTLNQYTSIYQNKNGGGSQRFLMWELTAILCQLRGDSKSADYFLREAWQYRSANDSFVSKGAIKWLESTDDLPLQTSDPENDIAKDYFIARWPSWLRWMLVMPAAVGAAIVVPLIISIANSSFGNDFSWAQVWIRVIQDFIFGYIFVLVGAGVAPKYQLNVSFGLTIIMVVIAAGLWFTMLDRGSLHQTSQLLYWTMVNGLAIVGAVGGLLSVYESSKS